MIQIIALIIAAGVIAFGADHFGHKRGVNQEKVRSQGEFDKINKELTDQKTQANALYRKKADEVIALLAERDELKRQIGVQDGKKRVEIAALHAKYAPYSLRFQLKPGDGGRGGSGVGAGSASGNAARDGTAPFVQLPDKIAGNLRELTRDADELNADYAKCYAYANKVR